MKKQYQPMVIDFRAIHQQTFRSILLQNIRKYICQAKRDGTVAMSVDNLKQCVTPPSSSMAGSPAGTNAQWTYAQIFREVCAGEPDLVAFTKV